MKKIILHLESDVHRVCKASKMQRNKSQECVFNMALGVPQALSFLMPDYLHFLCNLLKTGIRSKCIWRHTKLGYRICNKT